MHVLTWVDGASTNACGERAWWEQLTKFALWLQTVFPSARLWVFFGSEGFLRVCDACAVMAVDVCRSVVGVVGVVGRNDSCAFCHFHGGALVLFTRAA